MAVSRVTLRQALGLLEEESLIRRQRGSGTYVSEIIPEVFKLSLPTTWKQTVELSVKLGTVEFGPTLHNVSLPEPLGISCSFSFSETYCRLRRKHALQSVPFCTSDVYVDHDTFRLHERRIRAETVAPVIQEIYGGRISQARQSVTIIEAGADTADALQLPVSSPVAEVRRFVCVEDRVVYFAILEIPTRFVQLEFDLLDR